MAEENWNLPQAYNVARTLQRQLLTRTHFEIVTGKFTMQDSNSPKASTGRIKFNLIKATENGQLVDKILWRSLASFFSHILEQTKRENM